jgi:hypothetical protein
MGCSAWTHIDTVAMRKRKRKSFHFISLVEDMLYTEHDSQAIQSQDCHLLNHNQMRLCASPANR